MAFIQPDLAMDTATGTCLRLTCNPAALAKHLVMPSPALRVDVLLRRRSTSVAPGALHIQGGKGGGDKAVTFPGSSDGHDDRDGDGEGEATAWRRHWNSKVCPACLCAAVFATFGS